MICQTAWERRERENNSHELSVTFLSEEKKLSRGRESSQTDTLFTFGADIPLPPHRRRCPLSANRPHGSVMTALRCQPAEVCSVDAAVRAGYLTTNSPPWLLVTANQQHAGKCVLLCRFEEAGGTVNNFGNECRLLLSTNMFEKRKKRVEINLIAFQSTPTPCKKNLQIYPTKCAYKHIKKQNYYPPSGRSRPCLMYIAQ